MDMNIELFCNKTDYRDYLRTPFNYNGYTYATDGRILLRMPEDPQYAPLPEWNEFLKRIDVLAEMIDAATYQKVVINNAAIRHIVCPECDGEGEVEAETDYSTYDGLECKTCSGKGAVRANEDSENDEDCPLCEATGQIDEPVQVVDVLGVTINPRFLLPFDNEDGVEFAASEDKTMLMFKQGLYQGVIMRLNQ